MDPVILGIVIAVVLGLTWGRLVDLTFAVLFHRRPLDPQRVEGQHGMGFPWPALYAVLRERRARGEGTDWIEMIRRRFARH